MMCVCLCERVCVFVCVCGGVGGVHCVCVCVRKCVCAYICMYVWVCGWVWMYVCICMYVHVCVCACGCGCVQHMQGNRAIMFMLKLKNFFPSSWQISFSQSAPASKHTSLDKPEGCTYHCTVNKACAHAVLKNSDHAPWDCTIRSRSSNTHCVVYFTCLSGWSCVAKS